MSKNNWKRQLHAGDEIRIDNGGCEDSPTVIICEITYHGDSATILTTDGEKIECLLAEIS